MKKAQVIGIAAVFAVFGIIIGIALTLNLDIHTKAYTEDRKVSKEAIELLTRINDAVSEVASVIKPSVVNISTTKRVRLREPFSHIDPFFREFFGEDFFRQFDMPRERKETSLGSGVIIDSGGYILTNNHVIKGADEIKVTLSDSRQFNAKVVGTDPKTDLALIKIDASNLPSARWGDSDQLKVGELVIAVGSPYGLSQTVTSGVVSAKGRANVGITDYEDFIQTDAAINPGNSGGALVNIKGELIGIPTAIVTTTGGYQGIGFAIPSNMAKAVVESLLKKGKVIRGWLGVWIQPVTEEIARQFNLKEAKGVLVSDVFEGSPAEKAGIQRGDIIIAYNGSRVDEPTSFRNMVATTPPGKSVEVKVIRDGKEIVLKVEVSEQPEEPVLAGTFENALRGVHVQDITPELRMSLRIPKRVSGVIVTDVEEASPAFSSIQKDDIIMEIDRTKVSNVSEYEKITSRIGKESEILLRIWRAGKVFYLVLSP